HAVYVTAGIGAGPHLVFEGALLGLARHVHAAPAHVELPAVVRAAQPTVLVAAEEEGGGGPRACPRGPGCRGRGSGPRRAAAPSSAGRRARAARMTADPASSTGAAAPPSACRVRREPGGLFPLRGTWGA